MGCHRGKCGIGLVVGAVFVLAISIVGSIELLRIIHERVREDVIMVPGSSSFKSWQDTTKPGSTPRYYNMYLYNITNPVEVLNGGKPKLKQLGPFRYRQYEKSLNCSWSEDENLLQWIPWEFFKALDDDGVELTSLNLPLQAVYGLLNRFPGWDKFDLGLLYDGVPAEQVLFTKRSVHEMLFGYRAKHLDFFRFPGLSANKTYNESMASGHSLMYTGKNDTSMVRQQIEWKDNSDVYCCVEGIYPHGILCDKGWNSPLANRVIGTQGRQFAPGVEKGQQLWVFVDVIYRSAQIWNQPGQMQEYSFKNIDLLRFKIPPRILENATQVPENRGYWELGPDGLINVTTCALHMKTFLSKPHFLDADPKLRDDIIFLDEPSGPVDSHRDIWDTFIDVEPLTGKTMRAAERLQINVQIGPMPNFDTRDPFKPVVGFPKLREMLLPVIWLEKAAELTDEQASGFVDGVMVPYKAARYGRWMGGAAGVVMGFVGLGLIVSYYCSSKSPASPNKGDFKALLPADGEGGLGSDAAAAHGSPDADELGLGAEEPASLKSRLASGAGRATGYDTYKPVVRETSTSQMLS